MIPEHHPNPYAAPISETTFVKRSLNTGPLATRWQRFAGSFIDNLVIAVAFLPTIFLLGGLMEAFYPRYLDQEETLMAQMIEEAVVTVILSVFFLLIHGYLLATRGQTLGKFFMKTQIVSEHDELVPLSALFFKRYLIMWLLASIPFVGQFINIADGLLIFRENRKCLHDQLCGTKVVMLNPSHRVEQELNDNLRSPGTPETNS